MRVGNDGSVKAGKELGVGCINVLFETFTFFTSRRQYLFREYFLFHPAWELNNIYYGM